MGALPVKVGQLIDQIQGDIAAIFQVAEVGYRDAYSLADLLQGVALLFADFPPFLTHQLFGVVGFQLLLDVIFHICVAGGGQQHFDGVGAHVLLHGVLLDFFQRFDILPRKYAVIAGRALDLDKTIFFPVADGSWNNAQHFGNLVDSKR